VSLKIESNMPNLYLVLDLVPGVSQNEILYAYNRAKNTYAENSVASYAVFDDDSKEGILDEIEQAFGILGSPTSRREYDLKMGFETWKEDELDHSFSPSSNLPPTVSEGKSFLEQTKEILEKKRTLSVVRDDVPRRELIVNPEFEKEIENCQEPTGDFLKTVRLYRRVSIEEIAAQTRLSPNYIKGIEAEDASVMIHPVYLKGHIRLICQILNFPEPQRVASAFVQRLQSLGMLPEKQF